MPSHWTAIRVGRAGGYRVGRAGDHCVERAEGHRLGFAWDSLGALNCTGATWLKIATEIAANSLEYGRLDRKGWQIANPILLRDYRNLSFNL